MKILIKYHHRIFQFLILAGLATSFTVPIEGHCSGGSKDSNIPHSELNSGMPPSGPTDIPRCTETTTGCFTETFQAAEVAKPVDVLFVVDTSLSMVDIKQRIVTGLNDFLATLPVNSDFNFAVMLSHGSRSSFSGKLYQAGSEPLVLKSASLSAVQIENYLSFKLNQVPQDPEAGGGEEGLFSLFHAITTPALLSMAQSAEFFRTQAALAVVFISDARDICAETPPGVPAETNPGKINARIRDCEGLTAAGLTHQLKVLKGMKTVLVSGIIYTQNPVPANKEIGYGYTDMIRLNKGVAIDIAKDNIANGLSSIIPLGGRPASYQNTFTLSHRDANPSKMSVTVNGSAVAFHLSGDTLTLRQQVPAGAVVIVTYCLKLNPGFPEDCVINGLSQKACYLAKIMEVGCPLRDHMPANYKAPSRTQIIDNIKACNAISYPMTAPTRSQQIMINQLIDPLNSHFRKYIFTGFYYKPPYTDDFKKYFGTELVTAEQVFCDNNGVPPGAGSVLPKEAYIYDNYIMDRAYKAANAFAQELHQCVSASKARK